MNQLVVRVLPHRSADTPTQLPPPAPRNPSLHYQTSQNASRPLLPAQNPPCTRPYQISNFSQALEINNLPLASQTPPWPASPLGSSKKHDRSNLLPVPPSSLPPLLPPSGHFEADPCPLSLPPSPSPSGHFEAQPSAGDRRRPSRRSVVPWECVHRAWLPLRRQAAGACRVQARGGLLPCVHGKGVGSPQGRGGWCGGELLARVHSKGVGNCGGKGGRLIAGEGGREEGRGSLCCGGKEG
eukprot:351797-Chlamydomonas_euryale.AAC.2